MAVAVYTVVLDAAKTPSKLSGGWEFALEACPPDNGHARASARSGPWPVLQVATERTMNCLLLAGTQYD